MINELRQPEQSTNMNIPLLVGPYGSAARVGHLTRVSPYQTFPVHSRWDQSALAQAYHSEMLDWFSRVLLF